MAVKEAELNYLVALFADKDQVVTEAVNKQLFSMGVGVVSRIAQLCLSESDSGKAELMAQRLNFLNQEFRTAEFQEFVSNGGEDLSLFEGGFIVSSVFNALLKKEEYDTIYFTCCGGVLDEINEDRTALENVKLLNHVFYHRLGFSVCDAFITEEEDALLLGVLKSRRGNPIAISYIYFMLAQAAGLPIYPLCFPGGFVPVYVENGKELFYINIFNKGEIFSDVELEKFIKGQGLEYDRSQFKVRSEKIILSIYLESLSYLYSNLPNHSLYAAADRLLKCVGEERFLSIEEDI